MPQPESQLHVHPDTTTVRLAPDDATPYRRLHAGPGEPHAERRELVEGIVPAATPSSADTVSAPAPAGTAAIRLAGLIHFTDFQIADLASPSRVEYLQRLEGTPTWERMLPAYRPQEFLLPHAIESMVRAVNRFAGRDDSDAAGSGGSRWDLALTTGDNADSAQGNELDAFLTYLGGGTVDPAAGTRGFADAPVGLGDNAYFNPEPASRDTWKTDHGFPDHPGTLEAAARAYATRGLAVPWLSCFGNHDCLVQGRAAAPAGYDAFLTGAAKPTGVNAAEAPAGDKLDAYIADPTWVANGVSHPIEPDAARAMVSKRTYVKRHLASPGLPAGHGFTEENAAHGTAYYCYDALPGLRLIVLDTTNSAGHVDGCVDDAQFRWLQARLEEAQDRGRLVVLASHHGLSTLNNGYGSGDARGALHLADEVESLLHAHPNVVLWLSGHTHKNLITPRPGPTPASGFWEVSTGAISEWPVQFRAVEFFLEDSRLRIRTTMVDTTAPAAPDGSLSLEDLAALHRELAANDAGSVGGLWADGAPADRNQDLLLELTGEAAAAVRRTVTP